MLQCTGGGTGVQALSGWSGGLQLWWTGGKPGNKLVLALPVEGTGRYMVKMVLTKASDYGIVQLYLDDQKLGEPIDLYGTGVIRTPELAFGPFDLSAGQHRLTAEIVGANDQAIKSYMFGLDWVKLEAAK